MTTLKIKSDCVILDGKQLDMEKWALPHDEAAARLQSPDLKILTLQKACSCTTPAAFESAKGFAAHAAVLGVVSCIFDPRGVANEMKWSWVIWDVKETNLFLTFRGEEFWHRLRKRGIKRGDLLAILNPSMLPKAEGSESRAAVVQDEDQILVLGSVKGIVRCSAMTKKQAQCRQMVHVPSMGEYCRFHANTKDKQKPKGPDAEFVASSIDQLLSGGNRDKCTAIMHKLVPSCAATESFVAVAAAASGDKTKQQRQGQQQQHHQQKENIPCQQQASVHAKSQTLNKLLQRNMLLQQVCGSKPSQSSGGEDAVSSSSGNTPAPSTTTTSCNGSKSVRSITPKSSNSSSSNSNSSSSSNSSNSNSSNSNSTNSNSSNSNSNSSSAADRERHAVEGFVRKLRDIVSLPASGDRDMALAIQLSLTRRMRFDVAPEFVEEARSLHTQLFLHPNSELALLAFKNYRHLHHVATVTPSRKTKSPPQQQHSPAATAAQDAATGAKSRLVRSSTPVAAAKPAAANPAAAAAAGAAAEAEQRPQQPPPLESAADVRRALRGMQQKQKLVAETLSTLQQTQKVNTTLQIQAERQQKRLLKEQQRGARAPKMQRLHSSGGAAATPAPTEEEKKQILEKMMQLKSSVADIVDQEDGQRQLERLRSLEASDINHEFKQSIKEMTITAFFCVQCKKFADRFNPVCAASGHHQQPQKATKRFVQCEGCGHKPIPTINNQLPDGCPRCRVASKDLNFRVISLYTPKAEKLLEQEKLSIDGSDVAPFKRAQKQQREERTDDDAANDGFVEHPDLPATT